MSRLIKALQVSCTGKRYPLPSPPSVMEYTNITPSSRGLIGAEGIEYKVEARVSARIVIANSDLDATAVDPKPMDIAVRDVQAGIIAEVFGEFRSPLLSAINALNRYDVDTAKGILQGIYKEMFTL